MTQDYNNHSWSRMWVGTISLEGSHFKVRNKAWVSNERKCEPEGGIVSFQWKHF